MGTDLFTVSLESEVFIGSHFDSYTGLRNLAH